MRNDRPIDNPQLQKAMNEIDAVCRRYGFAGAWMLVDPGESAFGYHLHAPKWSAIREDQGGPLGFRIRAISAQDGKEEAHRKMTGAVHTIASLHDFGSQTVFWMQNLLDMLRDAGVDFEHTPHGGRELQPIASMRAQ